MDNFVKEYNDFKESLLNKTFKKLKEFKSDSDLNEFFYKVERNVDTTFLLEDLFKRCEENNLVINSYQLIKSIPLDSSLRKYPESIDFSYSGNFNEEIVISDKEKQVKIFDNIVMNKGILYKTLDRLGLEKSIELLIKYNIINEYKISEHKFYDDKEIDSFNETKFKISLRKELEEKHSDNGILVKIKEQD
ncbi:MAG: hypothetical protein ACOCRX_01975 [Candidatus Woesearchaeota archaeon]